MPKFPYYLQNKPWLQYPITLKSLNKISKTLDKVGIEGGVVEGAQVWRLCFFFKNLKRGGGGGRRVANKSRDFLLLAMFNDSWPPCPPSMWQDMFRTTLTPTKKKKNTPFRKSWVYVSITTNLKYPKKHSYINKWEPLAPNILII